MKTSTYEQTVPVAERVPRREKLAYAAGGLGGAIQNNADNYLLNPVFVVTLGFSPALMSLRQVVERGWDAITDALMGWVSDRTRTRWGRRKPYLVLGAALGCFALPLIFFFDRDWSEPALIAWLFATGLFLTLATTIWNIPYQCMLLESTPNSVERTNVAAWRGYVGVASGMLLGWVWWLTQLPLFHDDDGKPDTLLGARWVIGALAVVGLGFALLPLFVKARVAPVKTVKDKPPVSLRDSLRLTFTSRPFVMLILFTLLMTMGHNLKTGLDFFTKLYFVCGGDQRLAATLSGLGGSLTAFAGIAGIPVFQRLARRKGKRFALLCVMGVVFGASVSTAVCYRPGLPYLSLLPALLLAPAFSAMWVLLPSMTGDVVDDDELRTGERREGSYASAFSWFLKFSQTLAAALSGPLVVWAGFDAKAGAVQPPEVLWTMRVLLVVVPAVFIGGAIAVLTRYPLTTERIAATRAELDARRAAG